MNISSAYIFAKQITAGEEPHFSIVWFNSRNASPMQAYPNNSSPYITDSGFNISFRGRNSSYFPELPEGFIGIEATKVEETDLPYVLDIPLDRDGVATGWKLRVKADMSGTAAKTLNVYLSVYNQDPDSPSWSQTGMVQSNDDDLEPAEFYVFTGAGAFLNNRAGDTLIYDTSYIGCIVKGVAWDNKRYVNVSGATVDLNWIKSMAGELPSEWLT